MSIDVTVAQVDIVISSISKAALNKQKGSKFNKQGLRTVKSKTYALVTTMRQNTNLFLSPMWENLINCHGYDV